METYIEFLDRIDSFEKKTLSLGDSVNVSPSVALKVDKDNSFRDFYGDTVVFALNDGEKQVLAEYVDILYSAAPQCFCQRLGSDTFHMTLHDLNNSPCLNDVASDMLLSELKIKEKRGEIRRILKSHKIRMKSKYVFNMVNTSLVLGVYPSTRSDYDKVMELYSVIDDVKKLSYPFTPHITLAYYNVGGFDAKGAESLKKAVEIINGKARMEFDLGKLYYQKFVSMNKYIDVIDLTE